MPQYMSSSSCACSTSGTAAATEVIPGLAHADLSKITVQQGIPWTWRQCFVKSTTPVQILEERVGGLLVVNKSDHCFVAGQTTLRLINYNACAADTDDSKSVFIVAAIATDAADATRDVLTVTGLTTINKVYSAVSAASSFSPIGCDAATAAAASLPPYALPVCDGSPLLITAGITTRDDYYEMFSVSAAAGSSTIYSTVLGKVQPGDMIESTALGLALPSQVLRVDAETGYDSVTKATIKREKITIAGKTTIASTCAQIAVRRGKIHLSVVSDGGRCWEVTIPGAATAALQLTKGMKSGSTYKLGTLTVVAIFGVLVGGKLQFRATELQRSEVEVNPSHLGVL